MRTTLPVCAVVLAVSGAAAAQHARYPRAIVAPAPSELSDRVKPVTPTPPDPATLKPTITADSVLTITGLTGQIRSEQEQILVQLIEQTPDSEREEKSDYYFRLGELYAKQQRWFTIKTAEATTPQAAAQASNYAKTYLLKAVKIYKGLTDNDAFREYPKMDTALFYYGYTLQSGKYMKEARAVYDKLLKNYPNSIYVPEAHLAFADYYYDAGQMADAEARYKMVLKFPKSSVYWYALYKIGWIDLQLQRNQDALETFFEVATGTKNDKNREPLNRAAKDGFIYAYAQLGKTTTAFDAMKRLDAASAPELVERIADTSLASGQFSAAITVYRQLLARAPSNAHACQWQYDIARGSLSDASADRIKEIEELVRMYASVQKTLPEAELNECRENAAQMANELAASYYSEWGKTHAAATLANAERLYAAYLSAFPDPDAQATYADILWLRADAEDNAKLRGERWARTAESFAAVKTPEADEAAALAWMNALDVAPPAATSTFVLGKAARRPPPPKKIDAREAKLLAAIAAVEEPDADMMLIAAAIYRKYQHHDEAVTMLDRFLDVHHDDARGELAANLLLDSLVKTRQLDEVLDVADAIAGDTEFVAGKAQLAQTLHQLRKRAVH